MSNINVFNVNPINNSSTAKIKLLGSYNTNQRTHLPDIPIKIFKLFDDITCEILKCNITHHFIMSNLKLPVLRLTILYNKKITVTKLMSIYIYFTITDKIKSKEQLLKNNHNGKFTIETDIDGQKSIISEESEYINDEDMIHKLELLIEDNDMKDFIKTLKCDTDIEIKNIYTKQWKDMQEDLERYANKTK